MAKKKCNKKIEIYSDRSDVLTLSCRMLRDEKMEKKYPHVSHMAEATARSGIRAQVLWSDAKPSV